jgi:hypothetical protein
MEVEVKVRGGINCLDIVQGVARLEFDYLWAIIANESVVTLDGQTVGMVLH